ncbi:MAG: alpha-D-ribose 1-methylphosphonate 5-triphosphate diphosphatase [Spirochaetes bacterium]|nr:alpha-D-ribose 1-methylphosphonate 5-triphosphate diphosphatase [Spirochaetota bacterium]
MHSSNCFIKNVSIALTDKMVKNGDIIIENGIIKDIVIHQRNKKCKNQNDIIIFPGFIDLHNNSLEKNLTRNKSFVLPFEILMKKHDTELTFYGITTAYHCVSLADLGRFANPLRTGKNVEEIIFKINQMKSSLKLNTFIHLRYEILDVDSLALVKKLVSERKIDMISFMDHTPGYGIYKDLESYKKYLIQSGLSIQYAEEEFFKLSKLRSRINYHDIEEIINICRNCGIITVIHDPKDKKDLLRAFEDIIDIAEFPENNWVADEFRRKNVFIVFSAGKIVWSDFIPENLNSTDIICSEYSSFSMLQSAFILQKKSGITLNDFVNMYSLNPAKAIRLNNAIGSIEKGKKADFTVVSVKDKIPRVIQTIIGGMPVYSSCDDDYFDFNFISDFGVRNYHSRGCHFI